MKSITTKGIRGIVIKHNTIFVSAYKEQKEILIDTQKIWCSVKISEDRKKDLEYLAIYKVKGDENWGSEKGQIEGAYEILGILDIKKQYPTDRIEEHQSIGKSIILLGNKVKNYNITTSKPIQGRVYELTDEEIEKLESE